MQPHSKLAVMMIGVLTMAGSSAFADAGPDSRGARLLGLFESADTDKDGKVTEAELAAYRQVEFTAADTNADGLLSAEELIAQRLAKVTAMLADRTASMIKKQDANGDGSLSAAEMPNHDMNERFARLDSDDDGAVSKAEAEAGLKKFSERAKKRHSYAKDADEN